MAMAMMKSTPTPSPAAPAAGVRFTLADLLKTDGVSTDLSVENKKDCLQALADKSATLYGLAHHVAFDALWAREKLGTTAVGHGIAIPHARVEGVSTVCGAFVRLPTAIDFEAADGKPVDLVFMLLSPHDAGADHLHALAIVSRLLRDGALCTQLRNAKDAAAIYNLLLKAAAAE